MARVIGDKKIKVVHFVTGGFSGATSVVLDIISAHQAYPDIESLLVLRQKKTTTAEKLTKVEQRGINYQLVTGSTHFATIKQLQKIIEAWQPDILVAHGFPEHLIGRWAGKNKVPVMLQVEHASHERYTPWRLWQSRYLSQFTRYAIGVSDGVADVLRLQQLKCDVITINNGIHTHKFISHLPISQRPNDIIMVARFSKGKNHAILLQALAQLSKENLTPKLTLIGSGSKRHLAKAKQQATEYGISQQITWIDYSHDIASHLLQHKIFVLASLYEGLSLSVIEAMAAGCVVMGSDVTGIRELIDHQNDGFLFDNDQVDTLANALRQVINQPNDFQEMANHAQQKAINNFDVANMATHYAQLFRRLDDAKSI